MPLSGRRRDLQIRCVYRDTCLWHLLLAGSRAFCLPQSPATQFRHSNVVWAGAQYVDETPDPQKDRDYSKMANTAATAAEHMVDNNFEP